MQRTQVDYSYQKKQQNKLCISDTDVRVRTPADKWEDKAERLARPLGIQAPKDRLIPMDGHRVRGTAELQLCEAESTIRTSHSQSGKKKQLCQASCLPRKANGAYLNLKAFSQQTYQHERRNVGESKNVCMCQRGGTEKERMSRSSATVVGAYPPVQSVGFVWEWYKMHIFGEVHVILKSTEKTRVLKLSKVPQNDNPPAKYLVTSGGYGLLSLPHTGFNICAVTRWAGSPSWSQQNIELFVQDTSKLKSSSKLYGLYI
ncbi:hypothetical protein Anapl_18146 [Anas platyrhynchos]|uniref:Uncharacterized protein n=1 Tax=Anas platyrhynchos TaxID=8839 RepID=R0LZ24_ANAPL|nr:hypothetical protein Anapl_18146 [Anas platyrhynchos]